jgi:hypothetical protein
VSTTDDYVFKVSLGGSSGRRSFIPENAINRMASVDLATQTRLSHDIDIQITEYANKSLLTQSRNGRLLPSMVEEVNRNWMQAGRSRAVEFQYDSATQLSLLLANHETVVMRPTVAIPREEIWKALKLWQELAPTLQRRSFAVRNELLFREIDRAQAVLNILGAPLTILTWLDAERDMVRLAASRQFRARQFNRRGNSGRNVADNFAAYQSSISGLPSTVWTRVRTSEISENLHATVQSGSDSPSSHQLRLGTARH